MDKLDFIPMALMSPFALALIVCGVQIVSILATGHPL